MWGPAARHAEHKCLGELHRHQLGYQLVQGSVWFPCALGSPRGWTHGPSAIRAQGNLAMENLGSGCRGPRESPSCVGIMETRASDTSCRPGEHTSSLTVFQCLPNLGTLISALNTLALLFLPWSSVHSGHRDQGRRTLSLGSPHPYDSLLSEVPHSHFADGTP